MNKRRLGWFCIFVLLLIMLAAGQATRAVADALDVGW